MYDDADHPADPAEDYGVPTGDDGAAGHAAAPDVPAEGVAEMPAPGHVAERAAYPDGGAVAATGHPAVDAALASLSALEASPVAEHVAVFETAHDALRRALNDAGEG